MTDHSLSTAYLNVEDLRMINGEARISELAPGAAPGYTRARKIRDLVRANWDEIASYGGIIAISKNNRMTPASAAAELRRVMILAMGRTQ